MQNLNQWREQLIEIHEQLLSVTESTSTKSVFGSTADLVHSLIRYVPHEPLLVFNPDVSVLSAFHQMSEYAVDFSLIQESQDTLLGVLDRLELESLLESSRSTSAELSVSAVMGRNICIEPDTATLLEVMDRITMGACPCTIIVDSSGCPRSIITPQSLVRVLTSSSGAKVAESNGYAASERVLNPLLNRVA